MKKSNNLGEIYQENTDKVIRKSIGQYYTPDYIIKYILEKTIGKADIVGNPYISVIDISCGTGYFLIAAYDILKEKFILNINKLKEKYGEEIYIIQKDGKRSEILGINYWKEDNIHYHILKNCIYGADKDFMAVELAKIELLSKESNILIDELNIVRCDSLFRWEKYYNYGDRTKEQNQLKDFWSKKYDFVVGNPPYIGHKQLNMEYKKWLLEEYKDVFKDKSDLSFCFFSRILDILSPNGVAGIITSRYFMESPTGKQLRSYIKDNINILEIVDFYGADVFKGIGVAAAIYFFDKDEIQNKEININILINDRYKFNNFDNLGELIESNLFERFKIQQSTLTEERWILISPEVYNIYKKIEKNTKYSLKDIATSFQGVITGCDRAFVIKNEDINDNKIEDKLLKRWIKNSNVEKYYIKESNLSLIYSDLIEAEEDYPHSIDYIKRYRYRLENRREYRNGIRKWYELQWGRDSSLFDQPKIVFPYKATKNRFAIDKNSSYCSADVYSLIIKDEYKDKISLEFVVGLLNSSIYDFYFKLFGKKMGRGIYDYYPNSVLDIKIITEDIIDSIEIKVKEIMKLLHNLDKNNIDIGKIEERVYKLEEEIDMSIGEYFGLSEKEYEICMRTNTKR